MIFGSWTYDMSNVNVKGFNFGGSGDTTINVGSGHEVFNAGQKVKYILVAKKYANIFLKSKYQCQMQTKCISYG